MNYAFEKNESMKKTIIHVNKNYQFYCNRNANRIMLYGCVAFVNVLKNLSSITIKINLNIICLTDHYSIYYYY